MQSQRRLQIKIGDGNRLRKRLSEIDVLQLQKEIQKEIPDVEAISICADTDIIYEIILHRSDDPSRMNTSVDEKTEREDSKKCTCDIIEKHQKVETMERVSDAIQRTKGRNTNERLDNIERILSQLPENLKIKKV